jgi:hypothetical protein
MDVKIDLLFSRFMVLILVILVSRLTEDRSALYVIFPLSFAPGGQGKFRSLEVEFFDPVADLT